jgi:hypothetical protein
MTEHPITDHPIKAKSIPEWYLQTLQLVLQIDGGLRNLEVKLREAIDMKGMDQRVRAEMQGVLDSIHGIKGGLALVDMTAREELDRVLCNAA